MAILSRVDYQLINCWMWTDSTEKAMLGAGVQEERLCMKSTLRQSSLLLAVKVTSEVLAHAKLACQDQ